MTLALHARGPQFKPGTEYFFRLMAVAKGLKLYLVIYDMKPFSVRIVMNMLLS